MKIQYASDLHLEFAANSAYLSEHPLEIAGEILVLAGDITYLGDDSYNCHPFWNWASTNYEHVLVIPGNHEFYRYYDLSCMGEGLVKEIRENIHLYYNSMVRIGDVDFILSTLWSHIDEQDAPYTERCVNDFHRIKYGKNILTYKDFNREHERCLRFIKKAVQDSTAKHKIVVTHHVPSFQLCASEFEESSLNGAFTADLEEYIRESDINYWIFGHSHRNIDKKIGNTQCLSNQLGYVFADEHLTFSSKANILI